MKTRSIQIFILFIFLLSNRLQAQTFSNKVVGKKHEDTADSIKKSVYPYFFPFMGQKATSAGFDLPLPAGIMINYFTQKSEIEISNFNLGFNNGEMKDFSEIVRFPNTTATASGFNGRADVWLFPFWDVYGIWGAGNGKTDVNIELVKPADSTDVPQPVASFKSSADFSSITYGIGSTFVMGVGGGWLSFDMNYTWSDVNLLTEPAQSFIFGVRLGKTFTFKNPKRNLAVWLGGFRIHLNSETDGSVNIADVLPVDESLQKVTNWYDSLSPAQQIVYKPIYEKTIGALEHAEESTVQYQMNKHPKEAWNFIVGAQFQLDKHWMLRSEAGFLGSRQQFLVSLNYRFGL